MISPAALAEEPTFRSELAQRFDHQEREAARFRAALSASYGVHLASHTLESDPPAPASDPAPAPSIDPEARARIEQLERRLQAEDDDEQAAKLQTSGPPTFKMGGQVIVDSLYYAQSTRNRTTVGNAQDSLDFRRARLYAQGEAYEVFNYAIGFDFAQGTADNGRPVFIDNYIGMQKLPLVNNLRVGHFFEPFTLDRTSSNRNVSFMERALTDAFAPARNTGVMIFDQSEDQSTYWAIGAFRGGTDNNGDDAGDQEGEALTMRGVYRPYYDEPSGGRYYMHLGLGYSYRNASDHTFQYRSRPEAFGHGDENSVSTPFFVDTGVMNSHYGQLFGTEFAWCSGPWLVQSESVAATVNRIGGGDALFYGSYAFVGYMLTGEHRPYNRALAIMDRVIPYENVFRLRSGAGPIITGRGAWEVLARLSYLDLNDQDVQGGVLTDLTLGINWYLTPYNRMKFNYILSQLRGVPEGTSYASIFGLRCDMDF
jgi:phosphate-selective porin OprO/OprP